MHFKKNLNIVKNHRVFIIAEAGISHFGSLRKAKKLVDLAKNSFADAVKFQAYHTEELINPNFKNWFKRYKIKEADYEFYQKVKKYCDKKKIEFMLTPHTESVINWIKKLNCKKIKIGSGEIGNFSFLKKISKLKKPIIYSTGMHDYSDLIKLKKFCNSNNIKNISFLKCRTTYPTKDEDVNLRNFISFKEIFKNFTVGYSDHTDNDLAIYGSVFLGAKIIEKHISNEFNIKNAQDWKVSFDLVKMTKMVANIRRIEKILGDKNVFATKKEIKSKLWASRSIFAFKNIKKGEKFSHQNIKLLRPGNGLSPSELKKILGKKSKKNIFKNNLIKKNHYEKV